MTNPDFTVYEIEQSLTDIVKRLSSVLDHNEVLRAKITKAVGMLELDIHTYMDGVSREHICVECGDKLVFGFNDPMGRVYKTLCLNCQPDLFSRDTLIYLLNETRSTELNVLNLLSPELGREDESK